MLRAAGQAYTRGDDAAAGRIAAAVLGRPEDTSKPTAAATATGAGFSVGGQTLDDASLRAALAANLGSSPSTTTPPNPDAQRNGQLFQKLVRLNLTANGNDFPAAVSLAKRDIAGDREPAPGEIDLTPDPSRSPLPLALPPMPSDAAAKARRYWAESQTIDTLKVARVDAVAHGDSAAATLFADELASRPAENPIELGSARAAQMTHFGNANSASPADVAPKPDPAKDVADYFEFGQPSALSRMLFGDDIPEGRAWKAKQDFYDAIEGADKDPAALDAAKRALIDYAVTNPQGWQKAKQLIAAAPPSLRSALGNEMDRAGATLIDSRLGQGDFTGAGKIAEEIGHPTASLLRWLSGGLTEYVAQEDLSFAQLLARRIQEDPEGFAKVMALPGIVTSALMASVEKELGLEDQAKSFATAIDQGGAEAFLAVHSRIQDLAKDAGLTPGEANIAETLLAISILTGLAARGKGKTVKALVEHPLFKTAMAGFRDLAATSKTDIERLGARIASRLGAAEPARAGAGLNPRIKLIRPTEPMKDPAAGTVLAMTGKGESKGGIAPAVPSSLPPKYDVTHDFTSSDGSRRIVEITDPNNDKAMAKGSFEGSNLHIWGYENGGERGTGTDILQALIKQSKTPIESVTGDLAETNLRKMKEALQALPGDLKYAIMETPLGKSMKRLGYDINPGDIMPKGEGYSFRFFKMK